MNGVIFADISKSYCRSLECTSSCIQHHAYLTFSMHFSPLLSVWMLSSIGSL